MKNMKSSKRTKGAISTKIKQLLVAISTTTLISCSPQPAIAKEPQVSKEDFCTSTYELAEQIMIARQSGVPLTRLLSLVNNSQDGTPDLKNRWKEIIIESYEYPLFSGENYKRNIQKEFANKQMLRCLKNF